MCNMFLDVDLKPAQQKLQDRLVVSKTSMQTHSERLRDYGEQLSKRFLELSD